MREDGFTYIYAPEERGPSGGFAYEGDRIACSLEAVLLPLILEKIAGRFPR